MNLRFESNLPYDWNPKLKQNSTWIRALLIGTVVCFILYLTYVIRQGTQTTMSRLPARSELAPLPPDVEGVMAGYIYHDVTDGCNVEIRGKKIVRRGRKVLGLRTNFLKTNYFEDIAGEIRSRKGCVIFSASRAEWMMTDDSPLVLQDTIKISINKRNIASVRTVNIYPKSGIITIRTDKLQTFNFKHLVTEEVK